MAAKAASNRNKEQQVQLNHDNNVNIEEILENHSQMESQVEVIVIQDDDVTSIRSSEPDNNDSPEPQEFIDLT